MSYCFFSQIGQIWQGIFFKVLRVSVYCGLSLEFKAGANLLIYNDTKAFGLQWNSFGDKCL